MLAVADLSVSFLPSDQIPSFSIHRYSCLRPRGRLSPCAAIKGEGGNGSEDTPEESRERKQDVDWDKAWASYRQSKKKKKPFLSMFDAEQYVSRRPRNGTGYSPSEETDPVKRTERSTLDFWTDPRFTMAGFGIIFSLFIYMVVIIGAPPPK